MACVCHYCHIATASVGGRPLSIESVNSRQKAAYSILPNYACPAYPIADLRATDAPFDGPSRRSELAKLHDETLYPRF